MKILIGILLLLMIILFSLLGVVSKTNIPDGLGACRGTTGYELQECIDIYNGDLEYRMRVEKDLSN